MSNSVLPAPERAEQYDWGWWVASFGRVAKGEATASTATEAPFSRTAIGDLRGERTLELGGVPGQPLPGTAERASCRVLFDGVLYNREELSDSLAEPSDPARDDADLVLRAYLRWGEDVLRRLKGLFALIVWDGARDSLLCARDPLGMYPLFYAEAGGELLFSTSTEALVRHPRVSGSVNRAAIADFLLSRFPALDETFFEAVKRVPPGHAMRIAGASRTVYRYWDPHPPGTPVRWIDENELERFAELLNQAVNRCLDLGPAGIYLSGGFDSVTVAAFAADNCRRRGLPAPRALSLVFSHPECNEEAVQRRVASNLGFPQELVPIDVAVGPRGLILSSLDQASTWPVPLLNLWNPAYDHLALLGKRQGCQVIMNGGGGDEWLSITPCLGADLLRAGDLPGLYHLWGATHRSYQVSRLQAMKSILWTNGARQLLGTAARNVAPGMMRARARRVIRQRTPSWFAPDPVLRRDVDRRVEGLLTERDASEGNGEGHYLREGRASLDHPLVAMEMEESFEAGRRRGVHLRMPLLDADLVDFLYRTPPRYLYRDGRAKSLVRQTVARRFPALGFERQRKVSSTSFFVELMAREGPGAWKAMGGTPALAQLGIVDAATFASTVSPILAAPEPRPASILLNTLAVEAWLRSRL